MKSKIRILTLALILAFPSLQRARAQAAGSKVGRSVLPPNDPAFHGKIMVDFQMSLKKEPLIPSGAPLDFIPGKN